MTKTPVWILVVDDEPTVCQRITEQFDDAGATLAVDLRVDTVCSALEARKKWKANSYDAIIVDYHMKGGMSGVDLVEGFDDPFLQTHVTVMSGYEEVQLRGALKRLYNKRLSFNFLRKQNRTTVDNLSIHHLLRNILEHHASRPLPEWIARPLDRLERASTNQGRLTALSNVFENTAWFTSIVYLSELRELEQPLPPRFRWSTALGMGGWETLLSSWHDSPTTASRTPFSEPLALLCRKDGFLADLSRFRNAVRNPFIGHGELEAEEYYAKLSTDFADALERLREDLVVFGGTPLFVRDAVELGPSDTFVYQGYLLMGPSPARQISYVNERRLQQHVPYLVSRCGAVRRLSPWLVWRFCESCKNSRLFAICGFKRSGKRQEGLAIYKDGHNHALEVENARIVFDPR